MPKARIYAGFRHLFYQMTLVCSICGESNELEYTEGERRYVNLVNKRMGNINMGMYFHVICIMPQGNKKKFVECHSNIF